MDAAGEGYKRDCSFKSGIRDIWERKGKLQEEKHTLKTTLGTFPGGPVVKNPCYKCRSHGSDPSLGNPAHWG